MRYTTMRIAVGRSSMSKSEHVTALFVGGLYHLFCKNDKQVADMCWRTAVDILSMNFKVVGEA